jgi:DNA-binding transcriptional LysR family regulator
MDFGAPMNFREIDLNLLLVMEAMLKEHNVTSVARKLSISQPTVSLSLKKLREIFSDELFVRTAAGMQPTPKAMELGDPLRRMIDILNSEILNPPVFDPANSNRRFIINTTDIGEMVFMPPILKRLREFAPRASVECVCLGPNELARAMSEGEIDLAIGYLPELGGGSFYVQSLFEHPFVCLVRDVHPNFHGGITLKQYRDAQHIALVGEGHSQKKFETMIRKSGIDRQIAFRSQHFMNIPFIVRDSDLVATVPKVIAVAFVHLSGLQALWPPFPVPAIPIKQYWHQRMNNDAAQIWLRKTVSELFLNRDPTTDFKIRGTPAS